MAGRDISTGRTSVEPRRTAPPCCSGWRGSSPPSIFDDPDHPWKSLPLVHQGHGRRVGFEGFHSDIKAFRVERCPRPIERIEQEGQNRKRGRRRDPEPSAENTGVTRVL